MHPCLFGGVNINVTYENPKGLDAGEYSVKEIYINNEKYGNGDVIAKEDINKLNKEVQITAVLG